MAVGSGPARASVWSDEDRRYLEAKNGSRDDDERRSTPQEDKQSSNDRKPERDDRGNPSDPCTVHCFARGMRIRTALGLQCVETLRPGDRVKTLSGECLPVRAIRAQRFERGEGSWPLSMQAVRVRRNALGEGRPRRDLVLGPAHALYFDGLFVPVSALINGRTIMRDADMAAMTVLEFFHVVLDRHEVIEAEGAFCESFLELGMDSRAPLVGPGGFRGQVLSRLRSAVAPWVDRRRSFDRVRDGIEERAWS